MNKSLKFIQINKGDSDLSGRSDQINDLLLQHKPHLLIVNELNLRSTDTVTKHQFDNYSLETDNLDILDQMSRTGVFIHRDLHYKRRRDLESQGTSTVWLQITQPGTKGFLFQAVYRQFQRLGVKGSIKPKFQYQRWNLIVQKWEQAITEDREIVTMGDLNLNLLRWEVPPKT